MTDITEAEQRSALESSVGRTREAHMLSPLFLDRKSISDTVYTTIRDAIVDRTLPPGATITEDGLAKALGVSKTPVREALLRLRAQNLVQATETRRLRIISSSSEALSQAYDLRATLERGTATLAARNASSEQARTIRALAETSMMDLTDDKSLVKFRETDWKFHSEIACASGNEYLSQMARDALLLCATLRARDDGLELPSYECASEHIEIAAAIERKDADLAASLVVRHIGRIQHEVGSRISVRADLH